MKKYIMARAGWSDTLLICRCKRYLSLLRIDKEYRNCC